MNSYEVKQEARRQRLEARADRLTKEGQAKADHGWKMLSAIPFGQPILIGHHSEKRDRNYRGRATGSIDKGYAMMKEAGEAQARADSVGTGGISSDDPEAVDKLGEHLEKAKRLQDMMLASNKLIRKHRDNPGAGVAELAAVVGSESNARALFEKDFAGRIGFAEYQLSNNRANIRRIEGRIEQLKRASKREAKEIEYPGNIKIVHNVDENRVQIFFPGKPSSEVRDMLKARGFRWSPMSSAWQRHLNTSGIWCAEDVVKAVVAKAAP